LQIAATVLDDYPDGAWFVELAPLPDPRMVAQAVASALGVEEDVGRPVIEAVVKHMANRKLLLILDNCEHLIAACAELRSGSCLPAPTPGAGIEPRAAAYRR
jgi:predicted ATPase